MPLSVMLQPNSIFLRQPVVSYFVVVISNFSTSGLRGEKADLGIVYKQPQI
jgi:hypothetical protein